MQYVNFFHEGANTDLDYSKLKNTEWTFPSSNFRIINRKGQGLIITNVNGNDYDYVNGIGMRLPKGYIVLGADEYNGIAYLVLYNPTTNMGEIGCYPSPKQIQSYNYGLSTVIDSSLSGFEHTYKPLVNFNDNAGNRIPFRTTELTLSRNNLIDMFVRPNYDNSINMYMCDGLNYNRVINTGFDLDTGEILSSKFYDDDSFPNIVSQIPLANSIPILDETSVSITSGGQWKAGNTFFFIRYVHDNFNRTQFLTEIGPIQISAGTTDNYDKVEGIQGYPEASGYENQSDKRISFTLTNLDQQFKYFEIAYARHYSDANGIELIETKLIEQYHEIDATTKKIILIGNETVSDLTNGDVLTPTVKELICESHTVVDNRYYGANWTRPSYHNDYLAEFAKLIVPGYDDSKKILKTVGYKDPENTRTSVGYFRHEAYPFAVVFVFNGGIESDAYPTSAVDDYNPASPITLTEQNGIYRFPATDSSALYNHATGELNIMGIKFDMTAADTYRTGTSDITDYFTNNIIGFYFVRGERYQNMKYQGLNMYGTRSYRKDTVSPFLESSNAIVEQVTERATIFNGSPDVLNSTSSAYALVAHGCSNIRYSDTGGYDYYSESETDVTNDHEVGAIKNVTSGEYAVWLGQNHKKLGENEAASAYWGANRTDTENIEIGGRDDTVSAKGDGCKIIPNDFDESEDNCYTIPVYKGFIPNVEVIYKGSTDRHIARNYLGCSYYVDNKYGVISPDYIFDQYATIKKGSYIKKIATQTYSENQNGRYSGATRTMTALGNPGEAVDTYPWWWLASVSGYTNIVGGSIVSGATFSDVQKYSTLDKAVSGFVSEYTDPGFTELQYGWNKRGTCMWYWQKDGARTQGGGNRSMSTCKYIGVELAVHVADLNLSILSIFNTDPTSITGDELEEYFDIKNMNYFKISNLITIGADISTTVFYKGDCFLQRSFVKQMGWRGSSWTMESDIVVGSEKDNREKNALGVDDNQPVINFGHGLIIEIITENAINTEMRYQKGERTFYPMTDAKTMAVITPDTSDQTESFLTNIGYNKSISIKTYKNFNFNLPFIVTKFPTRIRYSDKFVEGSFIDGFRNFRELNYKDFNAIYGPIKRVMNVKNDLVSFQHDKINHHYTGERQATVDTSQGQLMLGTGDILAQQVNVLSDSGIYHKWSVVQGDNGIYALNFNKRTITFVGPSQSGQLSAYDLSAAKKFSTTIYNICESCLPRTDAVTVFGDNAYNGEGFSFTYDRMYGDVLFTIFSPNLTNGYTTIAFSEIFGFFTCEYSFGSPAYINLQNDLYSLYWDGTLYPNDYSKVYRHNSETNIQKFYGTTYDMELSYVVNGMSDENNTVVYSKRFDNVEAEIDTVGLKEIYYYTQSQIGYHDVFDPNDTRFWLAPENIEGKWRFPIQVQTTPSSPFYTNGVEQMEDSSLRGEWMRTKMIYNGNTRVFIKNVITNYQISKF